MCRIRFAAEPKIIYFSENKKKILFRFYPVRRALVVWVIRSRTVITGGDRRLRCRSDDAKETIKQTAPPPSFGDTRNRSNQTAEHTKLFIFYRFDEFFIIIFFFIYISSTAAVFNRPNNDRAGVSLANTAARARRRQ